MSIADGKVDILVDVDTKNAKKELEEFIKEYSNKKHKIEISVDANPQIHKQFKKIVQEFANSTVNINLGLDVSKAREQLNNFIKNCKNKLANIDIRLNTSKFRSKINNLINSSKPKQIKLDVGINDSKIKKDLDFIILDNFNKFSLMKKEIIDFYKTLYRLSHTKSLPLEIIKDRNAGETFKVLDYFTESSKELFLRNKEFIKSYKEWIKSLNTKMLPSSTQLYGETFSIFDYPNKLSSKFSLMKKEIIDFYKTLYRLSRTNFLVSDIGATTIIDKEYERFLAKIKYAEEIKKIQSELVAIKHKRYDVLPGLSEKIENSYRNIYEYKQAIKEIDRQEKQAIQEQEKYRFVRQSELNDIEKFYSRKKQIQSDYLKLLSNEFFYTKSNLNKNNKINIDIGFDSFKLKQQSQDLINSIKQIISNAQKANTIKFINEDEIERLQHYMFNAQEIFNRVSDNIKQRTKEQMALESQKAKTTIDSARVQNYAYSRVLDSISYVNKRILNLLRNAFVFNVISRGFRSLSEWSRILINRDLQLSNSLEIVKANLVNAFMPIWQAILPWIRALGEGLAWLSQQLVNFINLFAGGNAKVIRSVEEAKPALREFKELIGGADKALIPNIPKFKLNKPEKIKTPKIASQKPWIPSTLKSLETQKPKRKNILDNLRNNIEKISNKLPKINKNLYKSKRELASFDKLEVLKLKKSSLDAIKDAFKEFGENKSKSNLSKYLPNIADNISRKYNYNDFVKDIKDAFKGHKHSYGNFTFGDYSSPNSINTKAIKNLFGKSGKIDKMQLPKIDFEVNPQSTLNLESFKKWFSGNTGPATLFKSALIGLSGFGIAKLIAKLFGRSITLTPAGALVAVGLGSIANACIEATKRMEEGEKTAKKILEEHPDWVDIHVDKKGHPTFGVLPGEKPEDYSSIHDTQLAEILAIEERSKQIKLGKEKEYLKERSELNRENIKELDAIHEEERKKTKKSFAEFLIKTESFLNIFKNNSKNAIKEYYGDMKRISENTTDSLINNKNKDTITLRDELLKQKNIFSNFASDIEESNNNIANRLKDSKKEDTNTLVDELSKQKIVFKGFMYDIEINVGNIIGIIKNFVAGVISYFEDVGERMSNLFNPYHQQLRTESGVQIKPWYPKEFVEFLEENAKNKKLNIPHLAQGAVLRGGDPFLAYLGDQPRGQTNIEAPLSTIVDAFKIALSEVGSPINNININATGDMSQMIRFLNLKINEENRRIGRSMISLVGGE